MSEFEQIRAFVEIINAGSTKQAAAQMGLAPSAVSRRLKELELRLGTSLIQRTTRKMQMTEIGRTYYLRCLDILEALECANEEVRDTETTIRGRMKIAVPISYGVSELAPAIYDFMHLHPNLEISLNVDDSRIDLVQGGYDVGIRIGELEDSSLIARRIKRVNSLVCASPAFLREFGPIETLEQLKEAPALCYSNLERPEEWLFHDQQNLRSKVTVKPRLTATNGDVLREAALAGLGVVCEPEFILWQSVEAGDLVPLLTQLKWQGMGIYVVYPKTTQVPRRTRLFIDFLTARLTS
ncbi:MAG: LysR family transcriptional regulator [Rhizobiaceae bacterium]|nr:LysR family transcriptional regulator [Hyphomicrobiales bacterium]NRB30300.1 LysR family transcriptional regulator [Rhizobiaceae bacterium]